MFVLFILNSICFKLMWNLDLMKELVQLDVNKFYANLVVFW